MEPQEPKVGITKYIIGIVVIVIIILLSSIYGSNRIKPEEETETTSASKETINTQNTDTSKTVSENKNKTFTMADIATHNNKDSCYSAIRGTVYDLTSWIYKHPGGANNILKICGKDGTSAFTGKHEGEPKPEQILAGFEIGTLAK